MGRVPGGTGCHLFGLSVVSSTIRHRSPTTVQTQVFLLCTLLYMASAVASKIVPSLLPTGSGPARLSRDEVAASQRSRMLRAIAEAASDKGYATTVVADVVARAGVSRQTFYEMFTGKEQCFLEAYETCLRLIVGALERQVDSQLSPEEQLDRVLESYLDLLAAEPAVAKSCLIEIYAVGPRALALRQELTEAFTKLLMRLHQQVRIDRVGADDQSAAIPDALIYEALLGSVSSIVTTRVRRGETDSLPALREPLRDWLVRALEVL